MSSNLPPVSIQLVANGVEGVLAAFRSIEEAAKRTEANITGASKRGANSRVSEKQREYNKLVRETEKWARQEIQAEKRKNAEIEREVKRHTAAREAMFKRHSAAIVSGLQRDMSRAAMLVGAVGALGGGYGVVEALQGTIRQNSRARQLSILSRGQVTKEEALNSARAMIPKGIKVEQAQDAMEVWQEKSGDVKTGMTILPQLSELATAYNLDLKDLTRTAGTFYATGVKDSEKLLRIMREITKQGQEGAFDMKEMGGDASRLASALQSFSGDEFKNLQYLGAGMQSSIKGGSASAAEATESVLSLPMDIAEHKKEFAAKGIDIYNENGRLRDPRKLVTEAIGITHGNDTELEKMLGRRAMRFVKGQSITYQQEFEAQRKGGKSVPEARQLALNAVNKQIDDQMKNELTAAKAKEDMNKRLGEVDMQLVMIFEKFKIQMGDKLLPQIMKLVEDGTFTKLGDALIKIVPLITRFVTAMASLVADNPVTSALIGIGFSITKSFAAEKLSAALTSNIASVLGGGAGGGGLGSGAGLSGLAAMALPVAVALFAALMADAIINPNPEKPHPKQDEWTALHPEGYLTPEERQKKVQDQQAKDYGPGGKYSANPAPSALSPDLYGTGAYLLDPDKKSASLQPFMETADDKKRVQEASAQNAMKMVALQAVIDKRFPELVSALNRTSIKEPDDGSSDSRTQ